MDVDKAREIYENDAYDKVEGHDLIKGMQILAPYSSDEFDYAFAHDQMYFLDFEKSVKQMTEAEVKTLFGLGWHEDEDSWSLFS